MRILKKRSDFLQAARGRRQARKGFVLQGWQRKDMDPPRMGFTCSKKVGNAVMRNRAKRRLREVARLQLSEHGQNGWDYVLIGRRDETAGREFAILAQDLADAFQAIHKHRRAEPPKS